MLLSQPDVSLISLKLVVQRAFDICHHKHAQAEPEQSLRTPGVSLCTINVDPFRPLILLMPQLHFSYWILLILCFWTSARGF